MARLSTVVLVGRPNVGKSTLFNRITGVRRAIVTPVPGTTRDLIAHEVEREGARYELVDTGGMFGASDDPLHALVFQRGRAAIKASDLIVLIVDGAVGLAPGDEEIAAVARASGAPVILAINKVDDKRSRERALEFYRLGIDPVFEVSAEHGLGVGDLLDEVGARVHGRGGSRGQSRASEERSETGIAVIGRPNVGKSSLVNRLLREERVMVSDMPGTTRDAIDAVLRWRRRSFRIVDTAGIRRPGRVARGGLVETISVLAARRAIERCDVAIIVIDATEGPADQDAAIAGEADGFGRGVIIAVNKWDLVKDRGPDFVKAFDDEVRRQMKFLDYAPILHVSAATGERAPKLLEVVDKVSEARQRRVPTAELNRFIEAVTASHPPPSPGRTHLKIQYSAQTSVAPPTFVLFTNVAVKFHFSYERFLVNRLRDAFGFFGSPIRLITRARTRKGRTAVRRANA